ncbi:MAG: YraN family protein [Thiotrichales bacterium]
MTSTRQRGDAAEKTALSHLRAAGLDLIETNFRSRFGEIDLIMRDGDSLVFVEVRYRKHSTFGGSAASVNRTKQQRLTRTGLIYLQARRISTPCRFDVVAIGPDGQLDWLRNAFDATA